MAIQLINPNFNLIINPKTTDTNQSGTAGGVALNLNGSNGLSFSDVLEQAISGQHAVNTTAVSAEAASANTTAEAAQTNAAGGTISLDDIFQKAADTYHVPVQFLKAVAKAESNFNPTAESHAGAQGIMQLMPATARSLGVTDAFDPEQNIMGGAKYLSQQLARYDGNEVLALAAYNAGPGNVAKYNGVPPFKETQNYIQKVMAYAGNPITAGDLTVSNRQTTATNPDQVIQNLENTLLGSDLEDMDTKDMELLLNLYRYKMQMNVLKESDPDSDSESSTLFGSLNGLV